MSENERTPFPMIDSLREQVIDNLHKQSGISKDTLTDACKRWEAGEEHGPHPMERAVWDFLDTVRKDIEAS